MGTTDLKNAGLKVTAPRVAILTLLQQSDQRHWTAEALYRQLLNNGHDAGLATVYRVLTQFEAAGLVIKHHFDEQQSVFELAQEHHHDHLVCVRCGAVEEFVDETIEQRQNAIAEKLGYQITDHNLTLYGTCPNCQHSLEGQPS